VILCFYLTFRFGFLLVDGSNQLDSQVAVNEEVDPTVLVERLQQQVESLQSELQAAAGVGATEPLDQLEMVACSTVCSWFDIGTELIIVTV
jgi:hypothetical protein